MHRLIVASENDKRVLPATVTTVLFTIVLFNIKALQSRPFFYHHNRYMDSCCYGSCTVYEAGVSWPAKILASVFPIKVMSR